MLTSLPISLGTSYRQQASISGYPKLKGPPSVGSGAGPQVESKVISQLEKLVNKINTRNCSTSQKLTHSKTDESSSFHF